MSTYIKMGDLVQANTLLNALPIATDRDQQFKDVQTINLLRATDPQFEPSAAQEATLLAIATDYFSPNAGYAQGLVALFYGEYIVTELPNWEDAASSSGKTAPMRRKPALTLA